jgi:hypothetical protein
MNNEGSLRHSSCESRESRVASAAPGNMYANTKSIIRTDVGQHLGHLSYRSKEERISTGLTQLILAFEAKSQAMEVESSFRAASPVLLARCSLSRRWSWCAATRQLQRKPSEYSLVLEKCAAA